MDDLLLEFEDALITKSVSYRYAFAKKADIAAVFGLFDSQLTKFPKKSGWWDPPKNLAINSALMGLNLWMFSILPFHPDKRAYRAATERLPEGIVIHPNWHPYSQSASAYPDDNIEVAEKLIKVVKAIPLTIQSTIVHDLGFIEAKFGVKIPSTIESKLKTEAQKIAIRRWSTNRLKTKDTLIPFDGSKAIELGVFD
jgi:hypothetical protein